MNIPVIAKVKLFIGAFLGLGLASLAYAGLSLSGVQIVNVPDHVAVIGFSIIAASLYVLFYLSKLSYPRSNSYESEHDFVYGYDGLYWRIFIRNMIMAILIVIIIGVIASIIR